jgi:hypothetical protein
MDEDDVRTAYSETGIVYENDAIELVIDRVAVKTSSVENVISRSMEDTQW